MVFSTGRLYCGAGIEECRSRVLDRNQGHDDRFLLHDEGPNEVLKWNNRLRDMKLSEMSLQAQQYLEDYIPKLVPNHRPVYVWFAVCDFEEKRL
ncbi:MAG: DUF5069 domain-containing protein [Nitrospira sp.]